MIGSVVRLTRLAPPEARGRLRGYWALLAAVVVTRAAACVLLVPVLSRLFAAERGAAWGWIAAFVAVVVVHGSLQRRLARHGFELGLTLMASVRRRLVEHLARVPLGWLTGTSRITAQRTIDTTGAEVAQATGNLLTPLVIGLTMPAAIAVGLLFVAWPLGLAALVATPLLVAAWWLAGRCSRRADAAFAASIAELDDRVLEFARAQRTLRGAGRADPESSIAGRALATQHLATVSLLRWSIPGQVLFSLASQLALLALAVTALGLLRRGEIDAAQAVALLVVVVRLLEPFTMLAELALPLQAMDNAVRAIDSVLGTEPLRASPPAATEPVSAEPMAHDGGVTSGPSTVTTGLAGAVGGEQASERSAGVADGLFAPAVRLDAVTFTYPGTTAPALRDVTIEAPAGCTTAIVGPSGAGKSTVLGLVARFFDADAGRVLIDGVDVRQRAPEALYAELAIVFQQVYLFEGSIRDNVLVGAAEADEAQLDAVAALARVDEIVARLPGGWDTPVGEGGVALSGGERQRVGIARALLKRAPLLLVDEATSALDADNERAIADAIAAGNGERTTIVVAHRMSTIEQADHVVFVDGGRVVEAGRRAELLAAGGRFAAFHADALAAGTWTLGRA